MTGRRERRSCAHCSAEFMAYASPSRVGRGRYCSAACRAKAAGEINRRPLKALVDRFWPRVRRAGPDECWIWTGNHNHGGYGQLRIERRNRIATQVAWELEHGLPFPEGMVACHRCDNPPCVNPAHIFPGTHSDNKHDQVAKGRHHLAARTHCKLWHEFTPENTRVGKRGGCICRRCFADRQRENGRRMAAKHFETWAGALTG